MTSAKERAVEVGARAMCARDGGDWGSKSEKQRLLYCGDAEIVLRAAFPILADDLDLDLALAEQFASVGDAARLMGALADARARIQQMTESL